MEWIPVPKISDEKIIWAGMKVRLYGVGLNVEDKTDDYLEYIVSFIYGNDEFMQLTCLSQGEAGNILCVIKKDSPNHFARGKQLKRMMGMENTFVMLHCS